MAERCVIEAKTLTGWVELERIDLPDGARWEWSNLFLVVDGVRRNKVRFRMTNTDDPPCECWFEDGFHAAWCPQRR